MKECLIDTDILSYYMRGLREVVPPAQKYLKQFGHFNVSSLTVFEILKGLRKKRLVEKEKVFQTEILKHKVFGLDYAIMDRAATLLTSLEEKGTPIAYDKNLLQLPDHHSLEEPKKFLNSIAAFLR